MSEGGLIMTCALCHRRPPCPHLKKGSQKSAVNFLINAEIRNFWEKVVRHADTFSNASERMFMLTAELKRISEAQFRVHSKATLKVRRFSFDQKKKKIFRMKKWCLCCGLEAQIRHHIVPLSHGGPNTKRNIAFLCKPCHARVHPWLGESREQLRADGLTLRPNRVQDMPGDEPERAFAEKS